jgi:hypothetical protein
MLRDTETEAFAESVRITQRVPGRRLKKEGKEGRGKREENRRTRAVFRSLRRSFIRSISVVPFDFAVGTPSDPPHGPNTEDSTRRPG